MSALTRHKVAIVTLLVAIILIVMMMVMDLRNWTPAMAFQKHGPKNGHGWTSSANSAGGYGISTINTYAQSNGKIRECVSDKCVVFRIQLCSVVIPMQCVNVLMRQILMMMFLIFVWH